MATIMESCGIHLPHACRHYIQKSLQANSVDMYPADCIAIETTTTHKNLGILFDECLKFHDHATDVTAKYWE